MSDTPVPKLTITAQVPMHHLKELMVVLKEFHPNECMFWVVAATEMKVADIEQMFNEVDLQFIKTIRKN